MKLSISDIRIALKKLLYFSAFQISGFWVTMPGCMDRKSCRLSMTPETMQPPGHVQSVQALPFTTRLSRTPGKWLGFSVKVLDELRVWHLSKHRFSMGCPPPSCPWSPSPSRHYFRLIMELSLRLSPGFPIYKVKGIFPLYGGSTE